MLVQPRALKVVAALFMVSGVLAVIGVAVDLLYHARVNFDFAVLNLWIGRWLLAHETRGRRWALIVIQLNLLILPLVGLLGLFTTASPELRVFGVLVGRVSPVVFSGFAAAVCALQLWKYRVLNRSDIRALFPEPSGEVAARSV